MTLQAVLMGFSGVILQDEWIHAEAMNRLLVEDNLRPLDLSDRESYRLSYLGRGDADRIRQIWGDRGRVLAPNQLQVLLERKGSHYQQILSQQSRIPLIPYLVECLDRIEALNLSLSLVTGVSEGEVMHCLERAHLTARFSCIFTGRNLPFEQIEKTGFLHRQCLKHLNLTSQFCLAIESSYPGLAAGKGGGIVTLGLATQFPLHMIQRHANFAVDGLAQIEWDRLLINFETGQDRSPDLETPSEAESSPT